MYTLWMKTKKEIPLTYSVMKDLLALERVEFSRHVSVVAEEYQERLKAATELLPDMYQDIQILKEDVAILKEDVAILKEDVAILKEDVAILKKDVSVLKIQMKNVERRLDTVSSV